MAHNTQARAIARQTRFPRSLVDQSSSECLSTSTIFNTTLNSSQYQQRRVSSMLHSNGDDNNSLGREINMNSIRPADSRKSWMSTKPLESVPSLQYRQLFDKHNLLLKEFDKMKAELQELRLYQDSSSNPSTNQSTPESPSSSLLFISSCNDPDCGLSEKVRTLGRAADNYKSENIQLQEKVELLNRKLLDQSANGDGKGSSSKLAQGGSTCSSLNIPGPRSPSTNNNPGNHQFSRKIIQSLNSLSCLSFKTIYDRDS